MSTHPIVDYLDVQVQVPDSGYFVLDQSYLDGTDVLASGAAGLVWESLLCDSISLNVQRGGTRNGIETEISVGTLNINLKNAGDPTVNPYIHPNAPIRVVATYHIWEEASEDDYVLYTGTISDIRTSYRKSTDDTYVSISAVDSVQALANTMRFGAVNPGAEYETWQRRAERVLQSSPVPFVAPIADPVENLIYTASEVEKTYWSRNLGGDPYNLSTRDLELVLVPFYTSGTVSRSYANLTPGYMYTLTIRAYSVAGENVRFTMSTGETITVPGYSMLYDYPLDFVATSTSATLTAQLTNGFGYPEIASTRLVSTGSFFKAANTVYESNLVNHLDLATNTGRSGWYVDKDNTVRFAEVGAVKANFSDIHVPNTPTAIVSTRTNRVLNPSFETSLTGYTLTATGTLPTLSRPELGGYVSDAYMRIDRQDAGTFGFEILSTGTIPVVAGEQFAYSAWVEFFGTAGPGGSTPQVQVRATWTGATATSGTSIGSNSGIGFLWARPSLTGTVPVGATAVRLDIVFTAWSHANQAVGIDGILFERGTSTVGTYFDGDTVSTGTVRYEWTGTESASTSVVTTYAGVWDALHMCYTDVDATYDTRNIVNELTLANHARKPDPDNPGSYLADDVNYGPYRDLDSAATNGKRAASIETSLYNPEVGVYSNAAAYYASVVLAESSDPELLVNRVTFQVDEANLLIASSLEIYDRVTVVRNTISQTSIIIGIEHAVTPEDWFITLELMESS